MSKTKVDFKKMQQEAEKKEAKKTVLTHRGSIKLTHVELAKYNHNTDVVTDHSLITNLSSSLSSSLSLLADVEKLRGASSADCAVFSDGLELVRARG